MPVIDLMSPLGILHITETDGAITALDWGEAAAPEASALLDEAARQVRAYFDGGLQAFDLPLAPAGSPFQRRVYAAMSAIPWGETRTYGEIAARAGSVARAVGQACGSNPIPIIIPCHRVLAAKGSGGFSAVGGVESKIALLRHEGAGGFLL